MCPTDRLLAGLAMLQPARELDEATRLPVRRRLPGHCRFRTGRQPDCDKHNHRHQERRGQRERGHGAHRTGRRGHRGKGHNDRRGSHAPPYVAVREEVQEALRCEVRKASPDNAGGLTVRM